MQGIKSVFYDPTTTDVQSPEDVLLNIGKKGTDLITGTFGGILQGGEGFIRSISSYINMIDDDKDQTLNTQGINQSSTDTIIDGFSSLGKNIMNGITGIFMKPIEGAKQNGFTGAIKGVGKGLFGVVAKPVTGFLDASAGVIGGVRKAITKEEIHQRKRYPRASPMDKIGVYNKAEAFYQYLIQKDASKAEILKLKLNVFNNDRRNSYVLCIADVWAFLFKEKKLVARVMVKRIVMMSVDKDMITFNVAQNKQLKIACKNEDEARQIALIIRSKRNVIDVFDIEDLW
ncbi:vacuolar protein sorting-associated protein 13-like isoform X1 [Histomonas meleagridis]|uniref:vacuolar protein sorting-associated protein 13-like isoform X1 n=1 Tax=Histomonas meleagridis TaxID=135588 RepID=UPI00355A6373|nr:vacuolar protein sorting-associated protein 13-like isoform X1 [Histomonas meleagridis]KAH0806173.1 vacuolar protein sorting-associated protein 13-like isoform X1 [Histomonas meleagridis]